MDAVAVNGGDGALAGELGEGARGEGESSRVRGKAEGAAGHLPGDADGTGMLGRWQARAGPRLLCVRHAQYTLAGGRG